MADNPTPRPPPRRRRLPVSEQELHRMLYQRRPEQPKFPLLQKVLLGLIFTGLAAFVVYVTWVIAKPPPKGVRIVITGTRGLELAGSLRVDGLERELRATVPTNYHFAARDLSFTIKRSSGLGDLNATVFLDGKQRSSDSSLTPAGGIWIEMRHGVFVKRYETGTFEFKR